MWKLSKKFYLLLKYMNKAAMFLKHGQAVVKEKKRYGTCLGLRGLKVFLHYE